MVPESKRLPGRKVLIVEDEKTLANLIELHLQQHGLETVHAADGVEALDQFDTFAPDLVLLDLGLPKLDGMQVLKIMRATSNVPVLILTAREEEADELAALQLGGDDYLIKPVSSRKLITRVQALLRRAYPSEAGRFVTVGALTFDTFLHQLAVHGAPVNLTATEYRIIHHLADTPERVVSRHELIEYAMPESEALERAVDVHVTNIRRKIRDAGGGEPIRTVRGRGFYLAVDHA